MEDKLIIVLSVVGDDHSLIIYVYIQPDITAPGVSIIASYSGAVTPSSEVMDNRRAAYNMESGTSMSCPHVAGVVGLLKTLHPHWSSAAIRSAIMTTGMLLIFPHKIYFQII